MITEGWENFFLAEVGAAAALGGLLFVGVSLNLAKILAFPALPGRALDALILIIGVLVIASVMLVPGQPLVLLGIETLVLGLLFWVPMTLRNVRVLRTVDVRNRSHFIQNLIFLQVAVLPYIVGGLVMIAGNLSGLYWLAAAVIISFAKAVLDAWVLLVEINR
jgi:modulator of FtsH protease